MTQRVTSVEAFFMTGMLESWALVGSKPVIKPEIVSQKFYEYHSGTMKFVMRISDPARKTHKCNGSISISEKDRALWNLQFDGMCRPDAIPFLQFFHRGELSKKHFMFGCKRTNVTEGDYRYTCTPKPESHFTSFEGREIIRFEGEEITRFTYSGGFITTGFLTSHHHLTTAR